MYNTCIHLRTKNYKVDAYFDASDNVISGNELSSYLMVLDSIAEET